MPKAGEISLADIRSPTACPTKFRRMKLCCLPSILLLTVCSAIAQPGLVDPTFRAGVYINGTINTVAISSNGIVFIGGQFTNIDGETHIGVAKLLANGIPDSNFPADPLGVGSFPRV